MTDRELIIDALRDYERVITRSPRGAIGRKPDPEDYRVMPVDGQDEEYFDSDRYEEAMADWRGDVLSGRRAEEALRIRAELEDNSDYVVRGGA